jgi:hypothetical protein
MLMKRIPFLAFVLVMLVVCGAGAQTPPPIWVIAHMTNSEDAVKWSAGVGANGVEADLRFDGSGKPTVFKHGGVCDCLCAKGVCDHLRNGCETSTAADVLLKAMASQSKLGLVVIDSKVDSGTNPAAGANVIALLDSALFAKGYGGVVIVGAPKLSDFPYLQAAATAAGKSPNVSRIYFTIDGEGKDVVPVLEKLTTLSSANIVYGTGISACAPGNYTQAIALASRNQAAGVIGFDYIWTLDKVSSASTYLTVGADGVMTNVPDRMVENLKKVGYTFAAPGTKFPPATSKDVIKTAMKETPLKP